MISSNGSNQRTAELSNELSNVKQLLIARGHEIACLQEREALSVSKLLEASEAQNGLADELRRLKLLLSEKSLQVAETTSQVFTLRTALHAAEAVTAESIALLKVERETRQELANQIFWRVAALEASGDSEIVDSETAAAMLSGGAEQLDPDFSSQRSILEEDENGCYTW